MPECAQVSTGVPQLNSACSNSRAGVQIRPGSDLGEVRDLGVRELDEVEGAQLDTEASTRLGIEESDLALSMGISRDLEWAIVEGATIVRLGTAIFGERRV